jgi:hypothetical protein
MTTTATSTATAGSRSRAERFEGLVLVTILLVVAGFAGAASFTHVKDWTLANSPAGTGEWFGWANAVISELVPIAALLTLRRRKRLAQSIGYPLALLIASAGLSLAAQLAVAKPGPSGWLLSAVPALAFMALVKLVLAPVGSTTDTATVVDNADTNTRTTEDTAPVTVAVTGPNPGPTPEPIDVPAAAPVPSLPQPAPAVEPPAHLLHTAHFAVVNHEQTTGQPITADQLAARMSVTPHVAGQLLAAITGHPTPAPINGNPVAFAGGAR